MSKVSQNGTSYDIAGSENNEAIVFVHGLGLNRHIWKDYIHEFANQYRVLSYDLFGHGESVAPPRLPDLSVYAKQLIELMDELGIKRIAIIGFSLGGMINRRVAMDHGDRVSALLILNSPHERSPVAQKLVEERAFDSAQGGPGATLDATIERWFTAEFRLANPDYIQQVRDWVLANDATLYAQCRQVLATGVIELINPQPAIKHPTLVITCENDSGSTPAMSHGIASEIEGAQAIIVPELQHMGLVEKAALFIKPMQQFLKAILN